jgi:hypothetical protein
MFQYNGFTKPDNYKNISDFFTVEKENPNEYKCVDDFTKREIPSKFNIKNIGDINKINVKNNLKYSNYNIQNSNMLRNNFANYKNADQTFENISDSYQKFTGVDYPTSNKTNFDQNMLNNNMNHIANNLSTAAANNLKGVDANNNFKDQFSNHNLNRKINNPVNFNRDNMFEPFGKLDVQQDALNNMKNTMSNNTSNNLMNNNINYMRNNIKDNIKDENNTESDNFNNDDDGNLKIKLQKKYYKSTSSPEVFGPPMWFTLHNGSSKYPLKPSPVTKQRMMYFIMGIPVMIPCQNCREHATAYIEKNIDSLDEICDNKTNLFNFFVDFHNFVNKRLGKKIWTYEEAYELYNGDAEIEKMSY